MIIQWKLYFCLVSVLASVLCSYTPPKLTQEPEDKFGIVSQPLELRCQATGNPPPSYIWRKGDQEVDVTLPGRKIQNGYLMIDSFDEKDAGTYFCVVRVTFMVNGVNKELKLVSRRAIVSTVGMRIFSLYAHFPFSFLCHKNSKKCSYC